MIITSLVVPLDVSGVVRLCRCRCFVAAVIIFLAFEPLGYLFQPHREESGGSGGGRHL